MRRLLLFAFILLITTMQSAAQFGGGNIFGGGGMTQNGNSSGNNDTEQSDTTYNKDRFTIKKYFNSLAHKDTMAVGWMWAGSIILPGTAQIYNKEYWKLGVFYGGIGAMVGAGIYYNVQYNKSGNSSDQTLRNLFFLGAGLFHYASWIDGVSSYKVNKSPHAGKATVYSAIFPGLGQIYNGDYWKLPIYYGIGATAGYFWYYFDLQYERFRTMYNQATTEGGGYTGNLSTENLKYYRDQYRRYRDYAILGTVVVYALQIIDANVFAIMNDFDVSDDLTFNITPAFITPITTRNNYNYTSTINNAYGLSLSLTF